MTVLLITPVSAENNLSDEKIGYGQGRECDSENRPIGAINFNEEYSQYDSYALFEDSDKITLTFDQGYENGYTESILDTLKAKNVKAIFFLTGDYAARNKALVQRMISDGHIIGNHGDKHKSLPTLSDEQVEQEISVLHNMIYDEYNYNMTLFRPPCGEISERTLNKCKDLGYKTILWSFAYADWDVNAQPDPATAFERITSSAHNGGIYLLHSVSATNAEILPDVIDEIRKSGYEFGVPAETKAETD